MRNPMKPGSSGNIFADRLGYREISFEELPDTLKTDFADMMREFAKDGIKMRIYKKPDRSYSLMGEPENF